MYASSLFHALERQLPRRNAAYTFHTLAQIGNRAPKAHHDISSLQQDQILHEVIVLDLELLAVRAIGGPACGDVRVAERQQLLLVEHTPGAVQAVDDKNLHPNGHSRES